MSADGLAPQLWPADSRGRIRTDWLDARLSLAFGPWRQPGRERFGPLRVLNDDRVAPGAGFGMHGHRDLEILMVPLTTPIEHRDSEGRHQWVRPGQIQWMRAGRGIEHSQMNASAEQTDRHLQLWVEPARRGLAPEVHLHDIGLPQPGQWLALGGADAGLFQPDAAIGLWLGRLGPGQGLTLPAGEARLLQGVAGALQVASDDGRTRALREGDTLVFGEQAGPLRLHAAGDAMLLRVETPAPVQW